MYDPQSLGETLVTLTADIVSAHLSNNKVPSADVPALIASVHGALKAANAPEVEASAAPEPAVPVRASIRPDHIVCLEDG